MTQPIPYQGQGVILDWDNWGKPVTDAINRFTPIVDYPLIRRYRRTTVMGTTTTEVGIVRMDGISVLAGRVYRVFTSLMQLDSSSANDEMFIRLRYSTAGTATTGSSQMPGGANANYRQVDPGVPEERQISLLYIPAADETLSILLSCGRIAGAGNVSVLISATSPVDLAVEYLGLDVGSSGTSI